MATGAGKTYTACVFSHRLLEHAKFRRVLFLADRANLVRQTRHEFEDFRPPGTGRSFTELYNVQRLGPAGLDKDASVVIATIQRVYSMLTGRELSEEDEERSGFEAGASEPQRIVRYNPAIPIESFDLIITDECHRSIYGTWRQVLEYFDAFIVGLTATPSLHTMGFFGSNLVAQYPYERSVADGVNVPYEIFRIRTDIGEHGGAIPKGYQVPVRDKRTRAERYEELDQDLAYTAQELDRSVVVPNQIRTVLEAYRDSLFTELFPGRSEVPKTLIFCKDDHHAEEVVGIVREVFGRGNDFAKKITYKTDGADPEQLIRQFRTDYNPRIAVTVDMIATGTDVKPLEVLIFLRDVKSALYFEQMKGPRRAHDHADAIAPGDARRRGKDPLRAGRRGRRHREPEARRAALGPRAEDRLRPAHRRYRRGPPRRRCSLDLGGAPCRARPQDRRQSARSHRQGRGRPRSEGAGTQAARCDRSRHDRARGRRPSGHSRSRRRGAEGGGLPALRRSRSAPAVEGHQAPDRDPHRYDLDRRGHFLRLRRRPRPGHRRALPPIPRRAPRHARRRSRSSTRGRMPRRRLDRAAIEELRDAMRRPPWLLEPVDIWRAYKRLDDDRVKGNPARALSDIVMLVRYALGAATTLEPLPATIAGRFNLWLGREERAGRTYTEAQRAWLFAIRDFIAVNVDITPEDLMDAPDFAAQGGLAPRPHPLRRPPPPDARRTAAGADRMSPDALTLGEPQEVVGNGAPQSDLPVGWAWAQLGEIAIQRNEKVQPDRSSPLPFIGMDDVPQAH